MQLRELDLKEKNRRRGRKGGKEGLIFRIIQ
jgi:hypothetical protein